MINIDDLKNLQKLVNSELASKIQKSDIEFGELIIYVDEADLIEVIQFLKTNSKCKFRQLIDIAGVDYPDEEKGFNLSIYFYLMNIIFALRF